MRSSSRLATWCCLWHVRLRPSGSGRQTFPYIGGHAPARSPRAGDRAERLNTQPRELLGKRGAALKTERVKTFLRLSQNLKINSIEGFSESVHQSVLQGLLLRLEQMKD